MSRWPSSAGWGWQWWVRALFTRLQSRRLGMAIGERHKKKGQDKNEDADYFACEGPLRASSTPSLRVTSAPDAP